MSTVSHEVHHRLSAKEVSQHRNDVEAIRRRAEATEAAHEKTAGRWRYVYYGLSAPVFIASALAGVTGFADNATLAAVLASVAAVLTAVVTMLRPQAHRAHEVRQVLAYRKMLQRCDRYERELPVMTPGQAAHQYGALCDQLAELGQQDAADDVPLPELPAS